MNAPPFLLDKVLRATVGVHSHIPATHVSTAIGLGTDRRGTGTIVSPDGLILTVHYLLLGAQNVIVTMPGGDQLEAKIVGKDYSTGIGLLKIDRAKLPCLEVVSTENCVVGQEAFTVSSLGGEKRCADCGIITYLGPFDAVWEFVLDKCVCVTASSLNIGMSGGPICNLQSQVIGINYLNFADLSRAILGIPGDNFLAVRDELVKHGRRDHRRAARVAGRALLHAARSRRHRGRDARRSRRKSRLAAGRPRHHDRRHRRQRPPRALRRAPQSSPRRKRQISKCCATTASINSTSPPSAPKTTSPDPGSRASLTSCAIVPLPCSCDCSRNSGAIVPLPSREGSVEGSRGLRAYD